MMIRVLWAFAFLLVAVYGAARPGFAADPVGNYTHPLSIVTTDGVRHDFMVEIVRTEPTRKMGLMYRTTMPESAGMLFIFPESAERGFWMKNTLIPLDMFFIRGDGTISHIHENAKPLDLRPIPSNGPVPAVLELNGGMAQKLGLKPGDKVHEIYFSNALALE